MHFDVADFDNAAQLLTEAQKIAPDDLDTAIAEVDFLLAENKTDQAIAELKGNNREIS